MIGVYMEWFEHPYLFSLFPIMTALFTLSVVVQVLGMNTIAGFLALYAVVLLIVWVLGYVAFYSLKYGGQAIRWWRMRVSAKY